MDTSKLFGRTLRVVEFSTESGSSIDKSVCGNVTGIMEIPNKKYQVRIGADNVFYFSKDTVSRLVKGKWMETVSECEIYGNLSCRESVTGFVVQIYDNNK